MQRKLTSARRPAGYQQGPSVISVPSTRPSTSRPTPGSIRPARTPTDNPSGVEENIGSLGERPHVDVGSYKRRPPIIGGIT
jgi:hypothetical protein